MIGLTRAGALPWWKRFTDRHGFTLGLGHRWTRTTVDAFALGIIAPDRSTEGENRDGYDGTYSNSTFTLGLSLGVGFP